MVIMGQVRGGLANLCNQMNLRPMEKFDKQWCAEFPNFAPQGSDWYKVKSLVGDLRNHLLDTSLPKPTDEDMPLLTFALKALENGCHPGWKAASTQAYADGTYASRLIERFFTMTKVKGRSGSAYAWLTDPAVYTTTREVFGGIFHKSGTFDYTDTLTERDDSTAYASITDGATASGSGSLDNIHVLLSKSQTIETRLFPKVIKIRDLIDEIAGIPGPGDTIALPNHIFVLSEPLLQVCPVKPSPAF